MTVEVFSDASHSSQTFVAACGYVVLSDKVVVKHEVSLLGNVKSVLLAEFKAAIFGLQYAFLLEGVVKIILYTDCLAIVQYWQKARVKRKRIFVVEFLETVETILDFEVEVECVHVRAHANNKMNNFIDKSCRNQLRKYLNSKHKIK